MPDKDPMSQLYSRLGSLGFPPKYLHEVVLPEWWEDEVAHNPAGFAQGLLALSRNLGLDLSSLQNESVPVGLRNLGPCKFKKAGSKRTSGSTPSGGSCSVRLGPQAQASAAARARRRTGIKKTSCAFP